jgi:N-acetylglucosaminyldiphosphoundecaprenol N-acetyl-beta-D-mannosaminyltransferase
VITDNRAALDSKIQCGSDFSKLFDLCIKSKSSNIISFVNPFSYEALNHTNHLINEVDILFSDGALLCLFHNMSHKKKIKRASFDYSSIADDVFQYLLDNEVKLAIVGATNSEILLATGALKKNYTRLNIVYSRHGYFTDSIQKQSVIQEIFDSKAQVVLIGMGTPYQEEFSCLVKSRLPSGITAITCGGFLTQTSIKADYYYPIIKKLGLRWLQRMILHKHVRKRVFKDYPIFILNYLKTHRIFFKI